LVRSAEPYLLLHQTNRAKCRQRQNFSTTKWAILARFHHVFGARKLNRRIMNDRLFAGWASFVELMNWRQTIGAKDQGIIIHKQSSQMTLTDFVWNL
jgi:hypothetical protein